MTDRLDGYTGQSFMNATERAALLEAICADDRVLEIGTADGVTISWLASKRPNAHFVSVDTFPGPESGVKGQLGDAAKWCINRRPNMRLWVGTATELYGLGVEGRFDVVLVDGEHTYESCRADMRAAWCLARDGGLIAAHDYGRPTNGVKKGVDETAVECGLDLVGLHGTLRILRKSAVIHKRLRDLGYA
jgi:predicted O-methyltransferase YrrM